MGKAILHIHSTFSDGEPTVGQILDDVERNSDVDVVGITDHDDVRSYAAAMEWKTNHPDSRVQPLFGIELTTWAFKHILIYIFQPPFPTRTFKKFMPLGKAVQAGKAAGGLVIVPHVDAIWVGMGRHRLERQFQQLGVDGIELFTPVPFARGAIEKLAEMNQRCQLVELGGSDAHHLEDLYRVVVEFHGHSLADFDLAIRSGTTSVRWGADGPKVPVGRQVRQHTRALLGHPWEQFQAWGQEKRSRRKSS
ncbi:MAG TPA: PHP-associated domain-containing protein [Chloroflexota bacterium]|nr:PHP-associated domain-containing protein [Chloroflexota bacterium]